jgi:lysozyme family protein
MPKLEKAELRMNDFDIAFEKTMGNEGLGVLTNDHLDKGGQTYSGISRVYWPNWEGWKLVDKWIVTDAKDPALSGMVKNFYKINFWDRMQGDRLALISPVIAYEMFDSAVNMDVVQAIRFLQAGYNVGSGFETELIVDGKLGPETLEAIKKYLTSRPGSFELNQEILLNCMNGEQYIFYRNNPQHKRYRGWFRRL